MTTGLLGSFGLLCRSIMFSMVPFAPVHAADALVAVAANFAHVAQRVAEDFEQTHPYRLTITVGSTGKLYAQITQGAPFDVLLAADRQRPERLESVGLTVPGSRFAYASGQLVLWSLADNSHENAADALKKSKGKVAIANPKLAPYGLAAQETIAALGLQDFLIDRLVMGENVGQAFALVATGNAEFGLIARSNLKGTYATQGSRWVIPAHCHSPILQEAVLLNRAADNPAALAFMTHLRNPRVQAQILGYGYRAL